MLMRIVAFVLVMLATALLGASRQQPGGAAGVSISGDLRQWHKVTLTLTGPQADETANAPNPFLDYRLSATFTHESGAPSYVVPGYFAADGNAASSSATSGNKWRAHVAPDKTGDGTIGFLFSAEKGWRSRAPLQVRPSLLSTDAPARFKSRPPTNVRRTFERAAGCSMSAGTICSLPAAVNTS